MLGQRVSVWLSWAQRAARVRVRRGAEMVEPNVQVVVGYPYGAAVPAGLAQQGPAIVLRSAVIRGEQPGPCRLGVVRAHAHPVGDQHGLGIEQLGARGRPLNLGTPALARLLAPHQQVSG